MVQYDRTFDLKIKGGIERSGVRASVSQVKIFVQGRTSGTIDDRKLKKCLLTYNGENNVSGLSTFG